MLPGPAFLFLMRCKDRLYSILMYKPSLYFGSESYYRILLACCKNVFNSTVLLLEFPGVGPRNMVIAILNLEDKKMSSLVFVLFSPFFPFSLFFFRLFLSFFFNVFCHFFEQFSLEKTFSRRFFPVAPLHFPHCFRR